MPAKVTPIMPLDDVEAAILFIRAALRADPDARDLVSLTEPWLPMLDGVRKKEREAREKVADVDAARIVANRRLDHYCIGFGDDLFIAVGKDRNSTEWRQFYSVSVSKFVRQALNTQVKAVFGWLSNSKHEVLEKHRANLNTWATAADQALVATNGSALVRGEAKLARERMAEDLTRERDGLHDALSARAREKRLPRDWPDIFFPVEYRAKDKPAGEQEEPESPT